MATIDELISGIEVELEAAEKREQKARAEVKLILDTASHEGRSNLSAEEDTRSDELFAAIDAARNDQDGVKGKLARANKVKSEELESEKRAKETRETAPARRTAESVVRVGREERTYRKDTDPTGASFLRDVVNGTLYRDPGASDRISRHMAEERVERAGYVERAAGDLLTSGLGGIVVPQFLVDMTAQSTANLRPFADACTPHSLPADGMTVTVPRVTTPTSAAIQTTQLVAPAGTTLVETDLNITVKTASGWQQVSRQAIERGTGVGDIVLQDLFRQYATVLDNELVNGAATGVKAVGNVNTYTSGSPTGPEHYTRILGAASGVETALKGVATPDLVVMHGRRWYFLQGQMVSVWPMVGGSWGAQAAGVKNGEGYGSPNRGQLPNGMQVVVDNNIVTNLGAGTNQDQMYVTAASECHLWEAPGQPTYIRAEQPNASGLGILLVVYGYFAYTFGRYANSIQTIDGTGLIQPAGF